MTIGIAISFKLKNNHNNYNTKYKKSIFLSLCDWINIRIINDLYYNQTVNIKVDNEVSEDLKIPH